MWGLAMLVAVVLALPRLLLPWGGPWKLFTDAFVWWMRSMQQNIVLQPQAHNPAVDPTIIWFHCLGYENGGHIKEEQRRPLYALARYLPNLRIVAPAADPIKISTADFGLARGWPMRAWFDILGTSPLDATDERGLELAAERVDRAIEEEIARGTHPSRIFLGGASQGGALALITALSCGKHKVAGVLCTSSYMPLTRVVYHAHGVSLVPPPLSGINNTTPVLLLHGLKDDIVKPILAELTAHCLQQLGVPVSIYGLPGAGHGDDPFAPLAGEAAEAAGLAKGAISPAAKVAAEWMEATTEAAKWSGAEGGGQAVPTDGGPGAGLLAGGRPCIDRLHDTVCAASHPVFDLSGNRSASTVLGDLTAVSWEPPPLEQRFQSRDCEMAAAATYLFAAIALHDVVCCTAHGLAFKRRAGGVLTLPVRHLLSSGYSEVHPHRGRRRARRPRRSRPHTAARRGDG